MPKPKSIIWHGCYDQQWTGIITPDAFAHPAKFSKGLIERIYDHCLARGYLKRGDVVGDPFGGIGTGGITAAYHGLRWFGVELERKFARLGRRNFALHTGKWRQMSLPRPVLLQGDSRRFHELVAPVSGIVTSPPFTQGYQGGGGINKNGYSKGHQAPDYLGQRTYQGRAGDRTPENIEVLKEGSVAAVVTSPPYADSIERPSGIDRSTMLKPGGPNSQAHHNVYGKESAQIAALKSGNLAAVVTSPPYSDISAGAGGLNTKPAKKPGQQSGRSESLASQNADQRYGATEGQISQLKGGPLNGVVTSPPWEDQESTMNAKKFRDPEAFASRMALGSGSGNNHARTTAGARAQLDRQIGPAYGREAGQIGNDKGETYWSAMAQVYASCFLAIKPGGVIAVVVKDYVSKKKRVRLCDDTERLLHHCGFTVIERVHAMLVQQTKHNDLFEGTVTETKQRKSFFRRLAEKKGSPPIDYEEVIFARKPL